MSEEEKKETKYAFFVDAVRHETDKSSITGAEIKAIAKIPANYQLFLEEEGDQPDKAVSDGEGIDLQHKTKHFFAVPPATFGIAYDTI